MAKSLLTVLVQANRAMERDRKRQERESAREYASAMRKFEQAVKAEERAQIKMEKAEIADRKAMEKAAKIAHVEAMQAKAEELNFELTSIYEDIDGLLKYTLDIDDYIDLETLRRTNENPPFDAGPLAFPKRSPEQIKNPEEPKYEEPPKPKGIFGKKKKLAIATEEAKAIYEKAHSAWTTRVKNIQVENQHQVDLHNLQENKRLEELEKAKKQFQESVAEHNERLDSLINGLGYGTAEAIEEYLSLVISNSVYPEHFQVSHDFKFDPATAELNMLIKVPPPTEVENTKLYKYNKSADEIVSTLLSMKAQKDRYSGAVHQVAIRTFHEVFEADRRGLIKSISLEVGTEHTIPSTGLNDFIPFVAAASNRESFIEFDLSGIVILATLKHLGAAISKNPFELISIETSGVRSL